MQFKAVAFAGLVSLCAAQSTPSLVQALNSSTELSNLTALIDSQPQVLSLLEGATNITILAPNNAAIAALVNSSAAAIQADPALVPAILQYHVLPGAVYSFSASPQFFPTSLNQSAFTNVTGGQRVEALNTTVYSGLRSNSTIVQQSVNFTGGVVHIIDRVLTVPANISTTATEFGLSSFNGALNASGLLPTVNGLSDVTVFVPNNAAFQAIGSALPNLTMEQVVSTLEYHVINGTVAYSSLLSNTSIPSVQGNNLTITVRNATTVFVNNARVVIPDVLVANGVIHVIDEVLNPNNATAVSGGETAGEPAFSGASSVTEAPFTSGQPTPTSSIDTSSVAAGATGPASSSSTAGAWVPRPTGAIGAAALGGLALIMQL